MKWHLQVRPIRLEAPYKPKTMNSNFTNTSVSGCEARLLLGQRLQQPSPLVEASLIFIIIINIITFPFTVVLNALVMIAVKFKPRLRSHKSNILLALLASTDFTVGAIVQPTFIAVLVMFLLEEPSAYCVLRVLRVAMGVLVNTSLFHLAFLSGERYLAIKHSFTYATLVTDGRLLAASAFAWILGIILYIPVVINKTIFLSLSTSFKFATITFIFFIHVTLYREIRRHEQQIAALQVTQKAREQFLRDKKALKLTSIIITVLILCYMPLAVFSVVISRDRSKLSLETVHVCVSFANSMGFLNSLFNPVIYSLRLRQFRITFTKELAGRAVNNPEV